MTTVGAIALLLFLQIPAAAQQAQTYVDNATKPTFGPQAYKDAKSGTIIYVESDGRHLAALSAEGKILWVRDPFADAHLEHYRTDHPQIVRLGPSSRANRPRRSNADEYVFVCFNSSQFGAVRIRDGFFQFEGQD